VHEEYLQGVRTTIVGLGLTGLPAGNVVAMAEPSEEDLPNGRPACVVAIGGPERYGTGTNVHSDIGYAIFVGFLADMMKAGEPFTINTNAETRDLYFGWRSSAMRAFDQKRIAGIAESLWCDLEPRDVVVPRALRSLAFVSPFVVRAWSREERG
jgi:hypothetical protein